MSGSKNAPTLISRRIPGVAADPSGRYTNSGSRIGSTLLTIGDGTDAPRRPRRSARAGELVVVVSPEYPRWLQTPEVLTLRPEV